MHFQTTTTTPRTVRTSGRKPGLRSRIMDWQARMLDAIEEGEDLAREHGVCPKTIRNAVRGICWSTH